MNTCVDDARLAVPASARLERGACFSAALSSCPGEPFRSPVLRSCRRAGLFPARVRTSSSSPRVTMKAAPRRSVPVFFGALRGNVLLIAARARRAVLVQRAQRAGRLLRRADRGAQIHQCLRAIAGASRRRRERGRATSPPVPGSAAWPAAAVLRPHRAATPRARYCRRPAWSGWSKAIAPIAAAV